jgi:HemK-like putative methylase
LGVILKKIVTLQTNKAIINMGGESILTVEQVKEKYLRKNLRESDLSILADFSGKDVALFNRLAHRRFFKEPIEYLINRKLFFGRVFYVDRRVYIPTNETEKLVRFVLDEIDDKSVILDVGTGSGSIAITIKTERPQNTIYACDFHPSALEVANLNKQKHNVDIEFIESYYVDDLNIPEPTHIIADLPYGNWDENYILDSFKNIEEIKHMPLTATFHPDGIGSAYKELIDSIKAKKWKSLLYIESGLLPENLIATFIPQGIKYQYIKDNDYSITKIWLNS